MDLLIWVLQPAAKGNGLNMQIIFHTHRKIKYTVWKQYVHLERNSKNGQQKDDIRTYTQENAKMNNLELITHCIIKYIV